jgi:hypothetical protein
MGNSRAVKLSWSGNAKQRPVSRRRFSSETYTGRTSAELKYSDLSTRSKRFASAPTTKGVAAARARRLRS